MAEATVANPGSYVGKKIGDLRHGFGRYEYPDKTYVYEGEWFEGQKHGHGVMRLSDKGLYADCGSEYEGQFHYGEMTGEGQRHWKDGSGYTGQFQEGEREGVGEYTFADGTQYVGQFHNNRFHGEGTFTEPDGTEFTGQFDQHKRTGQGIETSWDGSSFDGDWIDGCKGGHGVYTSTSGIVYDGQWKRGMRHGDGKFTNAEGYIYEGTWEKGAPTIPAGKIVLKTARSDTDDFEPAEIDFMEPVPPERFVVDADAFRPDAELLNGFIPIPHLVFYVKKPKASDLGQLPPQTPAVRAVVSSGEGDEEDADLEIDYSIPPPAPTKALERKGIEAGRPVRVRVHRWEIAPLPKKKKKAAEEPEDAEEVVDTRDPFEAGSVASPRQMARLVGEGADISLEVMDEMVVQADQEGFATCKNLLVNGADPASVFMLVVSDSSSDEMSEVVSLAETLEIPILVQRAPPAPAEE